MRAAAAQSAAATTTPPGPLPPREKFLTGCAALPADLQRCLDPRWSSAHARECQETHAHVDSSTQARLQALIGK
jgi:hypothetical protein